MKKLVSVTIAVCMTLFAAVVLAGGDAMTEFEKADVDGITNFTVNRESNGFAGAVVGFGGATEPSAMKSLKNRGFSTIVNLRLADEDGLDLDASRAAAEAEGLQYMHMPLHTDSPDSAMIESMLDALSNTNNQPVYIHCGSATRAAALWMIGRVLKDGLYLDSASAEAEFIAQKPEAVIGFAAAYISSPRE